jgi:hypothetical protein
MSEIETLDGINQNTQPDETFRHGFYFMLPGRILGFVLSITGFFMFISLLLVPMFIGAGILAFGLYMITGTSGIDINYENSIFKEYNKVLGIKFGKWKSLSPYPFISIMSANKSNKASDITGLNKTVVTEQALGVYLLNNSHRKKILLKRTSPKMEQAKTEAERIAELAEKEIMRYNPRRLLRNN